MFKRLNINKFELVGLFLIIFLCLSLFFLSINEAKKSKHYVTYLMFENIPKFLRNNINAVRIYEPTYQSSQSSSFREYSTYSREKVAKDFYNLLINAEHKQDYVNSSSQMIDKIILNNVMNEFEIIYQNHQNIIRINFQSPKNIDHVNIYNDYISFTEKKYLNDLDVVFKNYYKNMHEQYNEIILNDLTSLSHDVSFTKQQFEINLQKVLKQFNSNVRSNFNKLTNEIKIVRENFIIINNILDNKSELNENNFYLTFLKIDDLNNILHQQEKFLKTNLNIQKNIFDIHDNVLLFENYLREFESKIFLYANSVDVIKNLIIRSYVDKYDSSNINKNIGINIQDNNILSDNISNLVLQIEISLKKLSNIQNFQNTYENYHKNKLSTKLNELIKNYTNSNFQNEGYEEKLNILENHVIIFTDFIKSLRDLDNKMVINSENEIIVMDEKNEKNSVIITDMISKKYGMIRDSLLKQKRISEIINLNNNVAENYVKTTSLREKNILYNNNLINIIISIIISLSIFFMYFFIKFNLTKLRNKDQ